MKIYLLLLVSGMLITTDAFGESSITNVTIYISLQTNSVVWNTSDTSLRTATFMCHATIGNQSSESLTASNLFQDPLGLSLKITDKNGFELARLNSPPFHSDITTIPAGKKTMCYPYYGIISRFWVSGTNTTVNIQLEGKLIGSSYSGSLTSNVIEMKIPK
jgi:hypothetical protein